MIPFNHLGPLFKYFSPNLYTLPVRAALAKTLHRLEPQSPVLDLGAGAGTLSVLAHDVRGDLCFTALDPAAGMLKYAPKHVMTKVGVAETIPFADGKFRCVLIGEALHHFKSPRKAFREIARVLEADGTLFIFDFDPTTLTGGMICRAERLLGEPGNFFPPETLCRLLRRTGFQAEHEKFGWRYVVRAQRLGD